MFSETSSTKNNTHVILFDFNSSNPLNPSIPIFFLNSCNPFLALEDSNPMEEEKHGVGTGSRWNPTKEQISILEGLYKQGVRTPSAEQIQNITSRLKVYGHIEGKNVFYWFQNHKARQRQKQKQEMVYYNQYLHKAAASASNTTVCSTTPLFNPSTGSNVICSPYYMTQHNTINYYPQYPKVPISSVMKRKQKSDKLKGVCEPAATTYQQHAHYQQPFGIRHTGDTTGFSGHIGASVTSGETLELFPLHPTGILKENSTNTSANCSEDSDTCGVEEGYGDQDQPFFDFFGHYGLRGG